MTPRRLLLVRHGLPDYAMRKAGDILPGPPLSATGRDQARQAAEVLRACRPVAIHASPLTRTWQTAEVLAAALGLPVRIDPDLREWHRTEKLHGVTVRLTRWLVQWLRNGEPCAVAVSHASPLLAVLRSALFLPHVGWHRAGHPECLEVSSGDRLEVTMASVFELEITPRRITARCLFHPRPRVLYEYAGVQQQRLPRPVPGHGENVEVRRPNWLHLLGYRLPPER